MSSYPKVPKTLRVGAWLIEATKLLNTNLMERTCPFSVLVFPLQILDDHWFENKLMLTNLSCSSSSLSRPGILSSCTNPSSTRSFKAVSAFPTSGGTDKSASTTSSSWTSSDLRSRIFSTFAPGASPWRQFSCWPTRWSEGWFKFWKLPHQP